MNILSVLKGGDVPKHTELIRRMDALGAKANAKKNNIVREPVIIDHLANSYSKSPFEMNGATQGLQARLKDQDAYCQVLEIKFGKFAFSPSHIHPHYCVVFVKSGEIIDVERDLRFDKGDWYLVKANEVHSAQSTSGAELTVYNTFHEKIADSIMSNKGYDLSKVGFDRVKISEV